MDGGCGKTHSIWVTIPSQRILVFNVRLADGDASIPLYRKFCACAQDTLAPTHLLIHLPRAGHNCGPNLWMKWRHPRSIYHKEIQPGNTYTYHPPSIHIWLSFGARIQFDVVCSFNAAIHSTGIVANIKSNRVLWIGYIPFRPACMV